MQDQTMVWNTDDRLQITSLTARLRDFAGVGPSMAPLHVSALWNDERDRFPVIAHEWVLGGEPISFDATVRGRRLHLQLAPLLDCSGLPCGVTGRADDAVAAAPIPAISDLAAFDERLRDALREGRPRCAVLAIAVESPLAEHAACDALLRHIRGRDTVARPEPGRFLLLLTDVGDGPSAAETARALLRNLRTGASIGIATADAGGSPGALVAAAEREMATVRRNGGHGIKLATVCRALSSPGRPLSAIRESV